MKNSKLLNLIVSILDDQDLPNALGPVDLYFDVFLLLPM